MPTPATATALTASICGRVLNAVTCRFCMFLKALVGAGEMERLMNDAIAVAKQEEWRMAEKNLQIAKRSPHAKLGYLLSLRLLC
jgi:hypothetical protein